MSPPDTRPATATPASDLARPLRRAALWLACFGLIAATAGATATASRAQDGDALAGKRFYDQRCGRCHSPDAHGVGPAHRGVVGRRAGTLPGFPYSDAMRRSGLVWDAKTLDAWLADPETLLPGQLMDVQVSDPTARRNLIAYLGTLTR